MLNFSFTEILLVVVVAVVFIGPKELPGVIRGLARGLGQLRALADELKAAFNELARESGVDDLKSEFEHEMRTIEGDDGQEYEAYDITEMMEDATALPTPAPTPIPEGDDV